MNIEPEIFVDAHKRFCAKYSIPGGAPIIVRIVADSITDGGSRLITWLWEYARSVHAEVMTYRSFCLAGDAMLEFDLPGGSSSGDHRVHRMRLDAFVDKWRNGARRTGAKPKQACDLSWIEDDLLYSTVETASRLGLTDAMNINRMCREGELPAQRGPNGRTWFLRGADIRAWRTSVPENTRYDMRARLMGMRIRQLNEDTGEIQWAHVTDAVMSGPKQTFEVTAGEFVVAGSADHRVLTTQGWKTIHDLAIGDQLIVRKFGKPADERLDPLRLKKIDGVWRSRWQHEQRKRLQREDPLCRRCRVADGDQVHHIIPVHQDPRLALVEGNVTLLCVDCHYAQHEVQGWQGGTYLYGAAATVTSIEPRGIEPTYDLTISGDYPNFVANGIVVHNSRNLASSRAISLPKMRERITAAPVVPPHWGQNQKGMQAEHEVGDIDAAKTWWLRGCEIMLAHHAEGERLGLHKQIVNRVTEPWMQAIGVISMTDHANMFHQRKHKDAEPNFQVIATLAWELFHNHLPTYVKPGDWHVPFVDEDDRAWRAATPNDLLKVSVGRCARVSYLTHDGRRDRSEDIALHDKLVGTFDGGDPGHFSPFEHQAQAMGARKRYANFEGWEQYRAHFAKEAGPSTHARCTRCGCWDGRHVKGCPAS